MLTNTSHREGNDIYLDKILFKIWRMPVELFKEILVRVLTKEEINIVFPNLKFSAVEMVELESFKALQKIKTIIENDSLSDFECIEKIVCVFEAIGSDGGNRHDFD